MRLMIRILLVALVILILVLTILKRLMHQSEGFYVELPLHRTQSECGDYRDIVVQISKEHTLSVVGETVPSEILAARLRELYRVRAERVLFVGADSDVRFQEVVGIIDVARASVTNLQVALLTPAAQKGPCLFIKRPVFAPKLPGLPE
jgi:biopolymer transport protein ExbD